MHSMTMSDTVGAASAPFSRGPGRKRRVPRLLIVAAVVISVAWTVAATLIRTGAFWLFGVLHVGPVLVFLAAFVASGVLGVAKPAGFEVREGVGFVVPASRGFGFLVVGEVVMLAFLIPQLIVLWTWGGADEAVFRFWAAAVLSVALLIGEPRVFRTAALLPYLCGEMSVQILVTDLAWGLVAESRMETLGIVS
jgi:hypothetical protein